MSSETLMQKAVFLDRDGTINVEKDYLYRPEDFEFIPGSIDAIRRFNQSGFKVVVVTNQSGVGRGYYRLEDVHTLHAFMQDELRKADAVVDAFYICPHHPTQARGEYLVDCDCRKGNPGMLRQAATEHGLSLTDSFIIGDKRADVLAGLSAGCRPYLVRTGYGAAEEQVLGDLHEKVVVVDDLTAAADAILTDP